MSGEKNSDYWGSPRMTSSLLLGVENESENETLKCALYDRFLTKDFKKYYNYTLKINIS